MATLTAHAAAPGKASKVKVYGGGSRPVTMRLYQLDFDSSYPTGGESISDIWNDFTEVLAIFTEQRGARLFEVNYSTKKLLMYTAVGTEATNASNQSTITDVRLWAIGH